MPKGKKTQDNSPSNRPDGDGPEPEGPVMVRVSGPQDPKASPGKLHGAWRSTEAKQGAKVMRAGGKKWQTGMGQRWVR